MSRNMIEVEALAKRYGQTQALAGACRGGCGSWPTGTRSAP